MPIQAQSAGLPLAEVAGFTFNVNAIIAIDRSAYIGTAYEADQPGHEARAITIHLLGPTYFTWVGTDADQAEHWYLQLTGQARVMPATGGMVTQ
jgi:hypothetical protein